MCGIVVIHGDSLDFASALARTFAVNDGGVRAYFGALSAFHTLAFIDMCHIIAVEGDGAETAHILAAVCQASAACVSDLKAADRTFVARNVNDLDYVGITFVSPHGELDALSENSPLLVDTAAHCGFFARSENCGNIHNVLKENSVPCISGYFSEDLVF
jgi:hypothetical protein